MLRKTTATFVSSFLLLSAAAQGAVSTSCLDDCLKSGGKLRCVQACSAGDDVPITRKKPRRLPHSEPVASDDEVDMYRELLTQAENACHQGNQQACRNLEAMKAGK